MAEEQAQDSPEPKGIDHKEMVEMLRAEKARKEKSASLSPDDQDEDDRDNLKDPLNIQSIDKLLEYFRKRGMSGASLAAYFNGTRAAEKKEEDDDKELRDLKDFNDETWDTRVQKILNDIDDLNNDLVEMRDELEQKFQSVSRELLITEKKLSELRKSRDDLQEQDKQNTAAHDSAQAKHLAIKDQLELARTEQATAAEREQKSREEYDKAAEKAAKINNNLLMNNGRRVSIDDKGKMHYVDDKGNELKGPEHEIGFVRSLWYRAQNRLGIRHTLQDQTLAQTELVDSEKRYKTDCETNKNVCKLVDTLSKEERIAAEEFKNVAKHLNEEKLRIKEALEKLNKGIMNAESHSVELRKQRLELANDLQSVNEAIATSNKIAGEIKKDRSALDKYMEDGSDPKTQILSKLPPHLRDKLDCNGAQHGNDHLSPTDPKPTAELTRRAEDETPAITPAAGNPAANYFASWAPTTK